MADLSSNDRQPHHLDCVLQTARNQWWEPGRFEEVDSVERGQTLTVLSMRIIALMVAAINLSKDIAVVSCGHRRQGGGDPSQRNNFKTDRSVHWRANNVGEEQFSPSHRPNLLKVQ